MRKLLLFMVLMSGLAFGQTKKVPVNAKPTERQLIEKKAKEYFEKEFVQKTFKDPYSYELKKMWSEEITKYGLKYDSASVYLFKYLELEKLKSDRGYIGLNIDETADYNKYKKLSADLDAEAAAMPESEKSKVVGYRIFFDTYGANSYGNKILGRYYIKYLKNGERLGDVVQRKD